MEPIWHTMLASFATFNPWITHWEQPRALCTRFVSDTSLHVLGVFTTARACTNLSVCDPLADWHCTCAPSNCASRPQAQTHITSTRNNMVSRPCKQLRRMRIPFQNRSSPPPKTRIYGTRWRAQNGSLGRGSCARLTTAHSDKSIDTWTTSPAPIFERMRLSFRHLLTYCNQEANLRMQIFSVLLNVCADGLSGA